MAKIKMTAATVERLRPPSVGQQDYFDRSLPSFGLRVTAKGVKSYFCFYRVGTRQVRHTLGRHPTPGCNARLSASRLRRIGSRRLPSGASGRRLAHCRASPGVSNRSSRTCRKDLHVLSTFQRRGDNLSLIRPVSGWAHPCS
jgi:hypothetical protein